MNHSTRVVNLLVPIAPGGALAINDPSPSHSVLGCSGHSGPVGPLLFQLCFSVSPPTVARPASLSLPLQVVRAWRVVLNAGFLRVCLIQHHFLRSICLASGSCPTCFISDLLTRVVKGRGYNLKGQGKREPSLI